MVLGVQQHHLGVCQKHRCSGPFLDLLLSTTSGTEPLHLRVNEPFGWFSDVWEPVLWKHGGQCHGWTSRCWVRETTHGGVDDKVPCLWSSRPGMIETGGLAPLGGRKKLTRSEGGAPRCPVSWDGCWWHRLVQFVKMRGSVRLGFVHFSLCCTSAKQWKAKHEISLSLFLKSGF